MPSVEMIATVVIAVIGSSGFWAFLMNHRDKNSKRNKILLGLGHDRIMYLCGKYIDRGDWITQDEYENLHDYLFKPYADAGGNGAAKRAMDEVNKLRIVRCPPQGE